VREMVSSPLTFIKKVASQLVSFWVLGGNRAKTVAFALMQIPVLGIAAGGMRVQLRSQPRAVFGVAAVGCYLIGVYSMSLAVCRYSMPLRPWMLLLGVGFLQGCCAKGGVTGGQGQGGEPRAVVGTESLDAGREQVRL